ncbi:MAG: hypothetical protein ACI8XO_002819 [Verrucomicrobiales bacterium]|jgi:hypothetical protein
MNSGGGVVAVCLVAILFGACAGEDAAPEPARLGRPLVRDHVTRAETIASARAYLDHEWRAEERHAFHGDAPDGIRIDTPDLGFGARGWWRAGAVNRGMPYKWGGFDTPGSFDQGLGRGQFAGDVYTSAKRRQLDTAVSGHAVGIDCSGFISRCWKLPRSYSTRELPSLCRELDGYEDLHTGDILNIHNQHVLLFEGFTDSSKSHLVAYEAGSPPSWKVLKNTIACDYLKSLDYKPYRYRNIRD